MNDTETYPVADYAAADVADEVIVGAASEGPGTEPEGALGDEWRPAPVLPLVRVPGPAEQVRVAERASAGRRLAAGLIDRLLPLPFLAAFFWPWALVVLAYDLGRDAQGASVGKRLLGLKTVTVSPDPTLDGQPCTAGRSLLRNLLWAGSRVCYLSVALAPLGFALDLTGCLMAALTPEGRHLGDRIGGTRVVVADRPGGTF